MVRIDNLFADLVIHLDLSPPKDYCISL